MAVRPAPEERKGGPGKAFVAIMIVILIAAGAVGAIYAGSMQPKGPSGTPSGPDGTANNTTDMAVYPTAWVSIATNYGNMTVGLYGNETPKTTGNFLNVTSTGFYTCTTFHRVVAGFVIQGGGHTPDMAQKQVPFDPIELETSPKLHNARGTIAMARTSDPDSATTQFFINLKDNRGTLDPGGVIGADGYAVFGVVVWGRDVVDAIAAVNVVDSGSGERSQPVSPVIIGSVTVLSGPPG